MQPAILAQPLEAPPGFTANLCTTPYSTWNRFLCRRRNAKEDPVSTLPGLRMEQEAVPLQQPGLLPAAEGWTREQLRAMKLRVARRCEGLWAVQDRSAQEFHATSLNDDHLRKELGTLGVEVGQLQGEVIGLRGSRIAVHSKPRQVPVHSG